MAIEGFPESRGRGKRIKSFVEYVNSGISPWDSLIYNRNLLRQLHEAHVNADSDNGKILQDTLSELTYTLDQAEAAAMKAPTGYGIAVCEEQISRLEAQAERAGLPPDQAEIDYYRLAADSLRQKSTYNPAA